MKRYSIFFILLISSIALFSQNNQTVYFNYDAVGNRTARSLENLKSTKSQTDENLPPETFSEKLEKHEIWLYPNPVEQQMNVKIVGLESGQQVLFFLYDFSGKQVFSKITYDALTLVDFSDLSSGTYILKIRIAEESTEWKIVRE